MDLVLKVASGQGLGARSENGKRTSNGPMPLSKSNYALGQATFWPPDSPIAIFTYEVSRAGTVPPVASSDLATRAALVTNGWPVSVTLIFQRGLRISIPKVPPPLARPRGHGR
jgi:hypothetical protein